LLLGWGASSFAIAFSMFAAAIAFGSGKSIIAALLSPHVAVAPKRPSTDLAGYEELIVG
jgi:hypothetical protein